jgi:hypothetical protein
MVGIALSLCFFVTGIYGREGWISIRKQPELQQVKPKNSEDQAETHCKDEYIWNFRG